MEEIQILIDKFEECSSIDEEKFLSNFNNLIALIANTALGPEEIKQLKISLEETFSIEFDYKIVGLKSQKKYLLHQGIFWSN